MTQTVRALVESPGHIGSAGDVLGSSGVSDFADSRAGLEAAVTRSCPEGEEWPRRIVAALRAALAFAVENPEAARVLAIESAHPASPDHADHRRMVEEFAERLRAGAPRRPATSSEAALVSSVIGVVADGLRVGDPSRLQGMAPGLGLLLLSPYVGFDDALRLAAP